MSFYPYPPPPSPFRQYTLPQTITQAPRVHSYAPFQQCPKFQQYPPQYAYPIHNVTPQRYTPQTNYYPQQPLRGQTLNNFYNYQPNYAPPRQSLPNRVPFENHPIVTNQQPPSNYFNNPKVNLKNTMPPQFSSPQRPISAPKNYFASPQKSILKPVAVPKENNGLKNSVKIERKPAEVRKINPVENDAKENKNVKPVDKKNRFFGSIKKIEEVLREEEVSRLENSQRSPKNEELSNNPYFPIIIDETKIPVVLTEKEIGRTPSN